MRFRKVAITISILTPSLHALVLPNEHSSNVSDFGGSFDSEIRNATSTSTFNGSLADNSSPILNFQVYPPVITPDSDCIVTLVDHAFANSYFAPFVGKYTPPPCKFDRVVVNFTLHTFGSQFDRMGTLFLGDHEVMRHTNAEPGGRDIAYTYLKELDQYLSLWKTEQKIVLDIPNIVNEEYTGILYTTVTARFYVAAESDRRAAPDQILPISTENSGSGKSSTFELPRDKAEISHKFPKNVNRAVIGIAATGQQREEFWYGNALTSDHEKKLFPESMRPTRPNSPFREVQLLIDGKLAGVSWPFPGIFTGGINPVFWRPMVGIDAFDLRQQEIDITPWLGLLCDGQEHTFEIRVSGLDDDGHGNAKLGNNNIGWYWVVSGNIFLFLGGEGQDTSKWMSKPMLSASEPKVVVSSQTETGGAGEADSLTWHVEANRTLSVTASLISDATKKISWSQTLGFVNDNKLSRGGNCQEIQQRTTGLDAAAPIGYVRSYDYPMALKWEYRTTPNELNIQANFDQGQTINTLGPSVFPNGLQESTLSGVTSQCSARNDVGAWPENMFATSTIVPASFQVAKHSGEASYRSTTSEKGISKNNIRQDFAFFGACIPGDTKPESMSKPVGQQSSQQSLERYVRQVKIENQAVKVDNSRLMMGDKAVPVPSDAGILQWKRPVTVSSIFENTTQPNYPKQPTGIQAQLQAILGVGPGETSPGFSSTPSQDQSVVASTGSSSIVEISKA